jgi:hypothetical protein
MNLTISLILLNINHYSRVSLSLYSLIGEDFDHIYGNMIKGKKKKSIINKHVQPFVFENSSRVNQIKKDTLFY